jgi:serine/threonine-protein kinase
LVSLSHHLAAVWFADVVGYTRLSEENEGEAVRLVHGFQRVAREVVAGHGGRVVKFLGDGALAEFSSTDMAVRSAAALLRAFASAAASEGLASDALRVGVHVGDVVATEDGDLYGDGVNVASRIQAAGEPGEVWVSEDVRRQLRQRPEFRFESRGERELKGLSRPLAMHAVHVLDAATWTMPDSGQQPRGVPTIAGKRNGGSEAAPAREGHWTRRRAVSLLGAGVLIAVVALGASTWFLGRGGNPADSETVLAVLPFENLSGDEATEPFVLGVHDDLLTQLSQIGTIKVISRTTVMGYEGSPKSVPEIAKELGATTVLEGGVQRSGDRIRMNVQLIDARTDEHLWAEQFDRTLTAEDVFAIQAEIAEQIAVALETALTPEQKAELASAPTDNLEALDLYYQGLEYYRSRGGYGYENARRAVSTLAAAVEADPGFAEAWAALAQAHGWQLRNGAETDTTAAREALDRAVALAPEDRTTMLTEGVYLYYAKADFQAADERFEAALSRWPDDGELLAWRSLVVRRLGHWDEALEMGERAVALDPRNQVLLSYFAETLENVRRYDDALRTWDQALALNPRDASARYWKILLLVEGLGDPARARRFLDASADVLGPAGHAWFAAWVSLYERDFDGGITALVGQPVEPDAPTSAPVALALLTHFAGRAAETRIWADSLQRSADRAIAEADAGVDPFVQRAEHYAYRGIAHALQGHSAEAVRDGRRAREILPISRDAVDAPRMQVLVATAFVLAGDRDAAFDVLDELAGVPGPLSSAMLRLNPVYDSIREDPRYDALLRKLEAAERSGSGTR